MLLSMPHHFSAGLHAHLGHPRSSSLPLGSRQCTCRPHQARLAARAANRQRASRRPRAVLTPQAYLHSQDSSGSSNAPALKVLVVGASPAGLAAAVSLAQQAGCVVEVHDSRQDPREGGNAGGTLVALGKRGLDALTALNLPQAPPGTAVGLVGSSQGGVEGLWAPGSANLGALGPYVNPEHSAPRFQPGSNAAPGSAPQDASPTGSAISSMAGLAPEPLPGLLLLQGMSVAGPAGRSSSSSSVRREEYSRPASRSKPGSGRGMMGGATAGIVAIDELSLTTRLLEAATAAPAAQAAQQPQLVLPGGSAAAAVAAAKGSAASLRPKGTTSIPQGPTAADSAETAQEAALPPVVPAPGTGGRPEQLGTLGSAAAGGSSSGEERGRVEVHYGSRLTLLDAANKQATVMGPEGQATVVPYDLCIAADDSGGGHLVASALAQLQDRQAAHKHPASAHYHTGPHGAAEHLGQAELEFRTWEGMPQDPGLEAAVRARPEGSAGSSTGVTSSPGPHKGWLLVWTGTGGKQETRRGLSSAAAAGSPTSVIPGGPTFSVMAWPTKGGTTWSGCVFAYPQVFEALRSQAEYEQVLRGMMAAPANAAGSGAAKLPAAWVQGIAAQLKRSSETGRVPAPASPPPHSLSAPSAGLVSLTPAAVPSASSPQLLSPGVSLGLAEVSALASLLAQGLAGSTRSTSTAADNAEALRGAVQQGLRRFDEEYGPEAQALHKLLAQLSWLRHPFSPAGPAAASAVPFGTLAWICAALGQPRTGLALQWKCLLAVLPLVAAVQRVLLYKLGLGRPDRPAAAGAGAGAGAGVAAGREKEAAALAAVAAATGAAPAPGGREPNPPAYRLPDVADAVEPCGDSFLAFLHTTSMRPSGIWRLLQVAPLVASLLWGALFWAAAQALWWGWWAFRAWGWAQAGVA